LIAPRHVLLDKLADQPWLRKVVQRLPDFLRPQAFPYGHIIALNGAGEIIIDLQDLTGAYPLNTSVTENHEYLYLGSLITPAIGRLVKAKVGL
jgi:hypothetical protein